MLPNGTQGYKISLIYFSMIVDLEEIITGKKNTSRLQYVFFGLMIYNNLNFPQQLTNHYLYQNLNKYQFYKAH